MEDQFTIQEHASAISDIFTNGQYKQTASQFREALCDGYNVYELFDEIEESIGASRSYKLTRFLLRNI